MSTIEDIRQVLQDFTAPELRAISARIDSIEQRFDSRLEAIEGRFTAIDQRFEYLTATLNAQFDSTNTRIESLGKDISQVRELLDFDRRLTRLEAKQSPLSQ